MLRFASGLLIIFAVACVAADVDDAGDKRAFHNMADFRAWKERAERKRREFEERFAKAEPVKEMQLTDAERANLLRTLRVPGVGAANLDFASDASFGRDHPESVALRPRDEEPTDGRRPRKPSSPSGEL